MKNEHYKSLIDELRYPPILAKACTDPSDYCLMQLANGETIEFAEAEPINCDWVRLIRSGRPTQGEIDRKWEVNVRLDQIIRIQTR